MIDSMGRIYIATGESSDLRAGATRRYQEVQDYSLLVPEFPHERLSIYLKAALTPVFGAHRYWYMFEFAKSRGEAHFHLLSICEGKQPRMLLHEMGDGEAREVAGARAKWTWGTDSPAALLPADTPGG